MLTLKHLSEETEEWEKGWQSLLCKQNLGQIHV